MSNVSDHEILLTAQKDKRRAFQMAFDRFWQPLYRQAYRKVQSEDADKDLTQEVLIALWHNFDKLDESDNLQAYLYAILRNKTLKLFEKDEVRLRYAMSLNSIEEEYAPSVDHLLLGKELSFIISAEVERMPARMKEIYVLQKYKYFSIKDIAEKLCLSEQTVKNQLYTASKRLRERLKEYDPSLVIHLLILSFLI